MKELKLKPLGLLEANAYIINNHRHHKKVQGHKFSIGAVREGEGIVGVVVVGRPTARGHQDGYTAEVTRLCSDGTPNVCSFLYAAAWRAARAMGFVRMGTYIRQDEPGTSLRAAGWKEHHKTKAKSWNTPSRQRTDKTEVTPRTYYLVGEERSHP